MHLFKNFFRLLKNNKTGIVIYGVIFIVMIIGVVASSESIAKGNSGDTKVDISNTAVSYVDHDGSALSKGLISFLSSRTDVTDMEGRSDDSIRDMVFFGMSGYHMDIGKGFGEGKCEITYLSDFASSSSVVYIDNLINDYIGTVRTYEKMGYTQEEACKKAEDLLSGETEISVVSKEKTETSGGKEMAVQMINQYYCYLVIGFLCLGVGHTLIANSDRKIGDRIESSPVGRKKISLINTLGLVVSGMFLWIVFIVINIALGYGTQLLEKWWWLILINSFATTLVACALASLITSFEITSDTLSMITNIVSLGMSFICGVFVPQYILGKGVLAVARFLPMYWSVYANNMTYPGAHTDYDFRMFLICIGVQLLYAAALAAIAAYVKASRLGKIAK